MLTPDVTLPSRSRWLAPFGANFCASRPSTPLRPAQVSQYAHGRFWNSTQTSVGRTEDFWKTLRRYVSGPEVRKPKRPLPVVQRRLEDYLRPPRSGAIRFTWMGHASSLLEIEGKRILIDPVWGERCSPVPGVGPRRFHPTPIAIADLPPLDAVIVSHDHYDHLDFTAIRALAAREVPFIVPIGVGAHLRLWGIPTHRIIELDWNEGTTIGEPSSIRITALPARHFSGRWIRDRNATLWASWAITGAEHRVYYSGDSGYFDGFRDIGQRHGPFDLTIIAIGAYAEAWPDIHLNPEEAIAVHHDVRGRVMVPVHWGTFQLALHSWFEPADRLWAAAKDSHTTVAIPRAGEFVEPTAVAEIEPWWRQ